MPMPLLFSYDPQTEPGNKALTRGPCPLGKKKR